MIDETRTEKIKRAAALFKNAKHAVAFSGAGISTDSGIPDFRSDNAGLWRNVDPLTVASIYGFRRNPQAFYDWVRPLAELTLQAEPNPAHYALVDLEKMGYLRQIITQNIDMLHTRAGSGCIYELHGHMRQATCTHCFTIYDGQHILQQFMQDGQVPRCPSCNGVIKPNVILFGEQLPIRELHGAQDAARQCDLMLIIGSSLEVAPASDLPILAKRTGAQLIIVNLEPTQLDDLADVVIHARAAEVLPDIVHHLEKLE
ncbi:MAG: NAD-dependent protein deacylase Cob2 [Anaerolineae bacterium]